MKKQFSFWSLVMILALCVGFTSCKDDEPSFKGNIVGKWQLVEIIDSDGSQTEANPGDWYEACDFKGHLEIKTGGTLDEFDACSNSTFSGTWKLEGDKLTMTYNEFPIPLTYTVTTLTENELVKTIRIMGETATSKFKRIN